MNSTTRMYARRVLKGLVLLLGALVAPAIQLRALIITTNCPDVAASLPQPKRIQSACPAFGSLSFLSALPQFSSGGRYHIFGNNPGGVPTALGLARSDTNGVFQWKVACSNARARPLPRM